MRALRRGEKVLALNQELDAWFFALSFKNRTSELDERECK
jgi:hypothetical protein